MLTGHHPAIQPINGGSLERDLTGHARALPRDRGDFGLTAKCFDAVGHVGQPIAIGHCVALKACTVVAHAELKRAITNPELNGGPRARSGMFRDILERLQAAEVSRALDRSG
jgi:hypothetical protein